MNNAQDNSFDQAAAILISFVFAQQVQAHPHFFCVCSASLGFNFAEAGPTGYQYSFLQLGGVALQKGIPSEEHKDVNTLIILFACTTEGIPRKEHKGLNTLIILVAQEMWKHWNVCVFDEDGELNIEVQTTLGQTRMPCGTEPPDLN